MLENTDNTLNDSTMSLAASDIKGQGNLVSLCLHQLSSVRKIAVDKYEVTLNTESSGKLIVIVSIEQLLLFFIKSLHTANKSRSFEAAARWCEHISKGFLSMTHGDVSESTDATTPYKQLFDELGVTKVERNGKGSKLYQLFIAAPTNEHLTILATNGFTNISPLLDCLTVVGLKVELPKQG